MNGALQEVITLKTNTSSKNQDMLKAGLAGAAIGVAAGAAAFAASDEKTRKKVSGAVKDGVKKVKTAVEEKSADMKKNTETDLE